jgi:hypothetical protein
MGQALAEFQAEREDLERQIVCSEALTLPLEQSSPCGVDTITARASPAGLITHVRQ